MAKYILGKMSLIPCIAAMMLSCMGEKTGPYPDMHAGQTEITFSLKLPGAGVPGARALEPEHEDAVRTADVYVFDNAGILVDIGYGRETGGGNGAVKSFAVTLQVGTDREIMVLANARELVSACYNGGVPMNGTVTKEAFRTKLTMGIDPLTGWNSDPASQGYVPIPMWGVRKNVDIDGNTSLTGSANSIKISRMAARVNVALNDEITDANFRLASVRVYNYNTVGKIIPDDDAGDWTDIAPYAEEPSLPADPGKTEGPLEYLVMTTPNRALTGEIYLFESAKGVSYNANDPEKNYMGNTCLVVGGYFNGSTKETFYRLDFALNEGGTVKYMDILRNHSYNVTIKKVSGAGKDDPDDAFKSYPDNIEAGVINWNDYEMEDVWFDGQYYYSVSPLESELWAAPSTNQIKIKTDYPVWSFELSNSPTPGSDGTEVEWVTVTSLHVPGVKYNGTISGNYLTYKVDSNTNGGDREAYFHFTAGRFTMCAKVEQTAWFIDNVSVTPVGSISPAGESRTVSLQGLFGDTKIRAWDATKDELIIENTVPGGTSGSKPLVIPELWHPSNKALEYNRVVAFEFYNSMKDQWQLIRSEDQSSYNVGISSDHIQGQAFAAGGQTITVKVWGHHKGVRLRASKSGSELIVAGTTIAAGNVAQASAVTGTIVLPYNNSGDQRTVWLEYSLDAGSTWTRFSNATQPKGNVILAADKKRVVALKDALIDGPTGSTALLTWAQAMGIPTTYDSQKFFSVTPNKTGESSVYLYNYNVVGNAKTGCGAYWEGSINDPKSGQGKWFAPSSQEVPEMSTRWQEIGWTTTNLSNPYWFSADGTATRGSYTYYSAGRVSEGTSKTTKYRVRCVRYQ